jgi:hypothetical protein
LSDGRLARAVLVVALCFLLFPAYGGTSAATSAVTSSAKNTIVGGYPSTSWALGTVVPEGSKLQGGGRLSWETVTNVTALVTLPNITSPARVVYAVLSVMAADGSIMQAAAGVSPNRSSWVAFSWFISGIQRIPVEYLWVLNSSEPQMRSGDNVSISIFRAPDVWSLKLVDESTGGSIGRSFPQGIASSLRSGDQEVFALESYSRAVATFQHMGNLTLMSVLVDGQRVTGGFYSYGSWDPSHEPVFVVGSSGSSPPVFITLQQHSDGSLVWGYTDSWRGDGGDYVGVVGVIIMVVLTAGSLGVVVAVRRLTRNTGRPRPLARVADGPLRRMS